MKSDFGIIILSKNFFSKGWTQKELDGLFAIEEGPKKVIIPIWHDVDIADVKKFSPMLAGRVAAKTTQDLDIIVKKVLEAIDPEADFFINKDAAVKVSQSEIILGDDEWGVETSFTVQNMSNHILHDITIDVTFEGIDLKFNDVIFQLLERTNIARGEVGSYIVDTELFGMGMIDDEGHEHMDLRIFQLGPHELKTILVKSKKTFRTPALIRISVLNFTFGAGKIFVK
jgi:hypothetical protein